MVRLGDHFCLLGVFGGCDIRYLQYAFFCNIYLHCGRQSMAVTGFAIVKESEEEVKNKQGYGVFFNRLFLHIDKR